MRTGCKNWGPRLRGLKNMPKKLKVGVIFGGKSFEKEVSLATGRYIYQLLDPGLFFGTPIFMDEKGRLWEVPDKLVLLNKISDIKARLSEAKRIKTESLGKRVDFIFIALLGKYGEDGCIQGVLELLGIPYTGSGVLASAVGMNKKVHKRLFKVSGFKVPRGVAVKKGELKDRETVLAQIEKEVGYPLVIKPTREGSSIGVGVVKKKKDLAPAFKLAFEFDKEVLVEEYIRGVEFTCVVLGNKDPVALLPTEICLKHDFFTYEDKYMPGRTQVITPARLSKKMIKKVQETAQAIYRLTGCQGYGRVDGWVRGEEIIIGEPHTGTIMIPSSFVFQQAAQHKIKVETEWRGAKKTKIPMSPRLLVTKIIKMSQEAHAKKKGPLGARE